MKYFFFLSFFLFIRVTANSQELLKKNQEQINAIMTNKNGILSDEEYQTFNLGNSFPTLPHTLTYKFSEDRVKITNNYQTVIFLSKNSTCYEYMDFYKGDTSLKKIISNFNKDTSGLKKIGDLNWINQSKNFGYKILLRKFPNSDKILKIVVDTYTTVPNISNN